MITHLEPDILESQVKWALESITKNKASEGDGIPLELFQILKDAMKVLPANLENSAVATGMEKLSFHSNSKERKCQRMIKLLHNCTVEARLQQHMKHELPDVQAGLRKGRGTRDQITNMRRITEKAREFQKNIYSCFTGYANAFEHVDHSKP